ncbi:MAG: hypothetical protein ACRERD_05545, partial [Candidatus Binatia bacterium]
MLKINLSPILASLISGLALVASLSTPLSAGDEEEGEWEQLRPVEDTRMWKECRGGTLQKKALCYQKKLEEVLQSQGTAPALTTLEELAAQDSDVLRDSHVYAHHLGRTSFSHYKNAATAFSHCRDVFWSGCYHGVLEGYLSSLSQVEPKDVATLCDNAIDTRQSRFLKYQCVHGLGHGLTMYLQHDIFKALAFCDALPT